MFAGFVEPDPELCFFIFFFSFKIVNIPDGICLFVFCESKS